MRVVFALTVLGGIGLVTLAVWPGMIEDLVFGFPFLCVSQPLLGFWFLLLFGLAVRDLTTRRESPARRRWWGVRSVGIMFGTLGLLWLHVPQRIAFAFCYADLRGLVDDAHVVAERDRGVGPSGGAIPRGSVRTGQTGRGIHPDRHWAGRDRPAPDVLSVLAFRPNDQGTPFGNAHYGHYHLFGDWYVFKASNDW